jgi:hypothetical protein
MKNFATPSFRLRDTSFEIRLVYTLFLLLILGGLVTTWFLQFQRIGISYERVVAYYLGGEIAGQLFFAKNLNALLDETHSCLQYERRVFDSRPSFHGNFAAQRSQAGFYSDDFFLSRL